MIDQEREAHREEIIAKAMDVADHLPPPVFGVQDLRIKALKEEVEALRDYDRRHQAIAP